MRARSLNRLRGIRLLAALFGAVLCLLGLAAVAPAHAAYMIPGGTSRPKDFAFIKKDGLYHIFYIRHDVELPTDSTEKDFGHAVSNDLYHWTILPNVLPCASDGSGWDGQHVWAPSIVEHDGAYWMFYSGVGSDDPTSAHVQRMGVAVSTDLMDWQRLGPVPILDATQAPWAWWQPNSSRPAFRDPYVMPDPATPGRWLMYYTASYAPDTDATVVGVAQSNGDFMQWTDLGPLLVTWRNYSFNPITESPHLFEHNGLWYLMITTSSGQPLSYFTTADPTGPLPAWTYRGRLRNMLGYDTSIWFASEYLREGTHDYFAFVAGDRVEIREMLWGSGQTFSLLQPPLFHVLDVAWTDTTAAEGAVTQLKLTTVNYFAGVPQLQAYAVDDDGVETAIPMDSLAINAAPVLVADTSYIAFTARRWPPVEAVDSPAVTRMRIRLVDGTAASGLLTIGPPAPVSNDPSVRPDPSASDRIGAIAIRRRGDLRGAPEITVQLPRAAQARVDVYDITGRRVRTLADRMLDRGLTLLPWDGRNDDGAALGRGIYFVRVAAGGQVGSLRLVLMK